MPQGIPLSIAKGGTTVRVTKLHGDEAMQRHLEAIGFVEGSEVQIVTQADAPRPAWNPSAAPVTAALRGGSCNDDGHGPMELRREEEDSEDPS